MLEIFFLRQNLLNDLAHSRIKRLFQNKHQIQFFIGEFADEAEEGETPRIFAHFRIQMVYIRRQVLLYSRSYPFAHSRLQLSCGGALLLCPPCFDYVQILRNSQDMRCEKSITRDATFQFIDKFLLLCRSLQNNYCFWELAAKLAINVQGLNPNPFVLSKLLINSSPKA